MATEGGSPNSDFLYDFFCTVCEGNVEAIKRCEDCQEDMCGECLTNHNKFRAMREHSLIDKTEVGKQDGAVRPDLPRARCNDHPGNRIELYCKVHDEVGCANCFNLDHGACQDRHYIPKVAVGIKNTEEWQTVTDGMVKLTKRTERIKQAREEDLKRISAERNNAIKTIDDRYDVIKKRLDDLKSASIDDVNKTFGELETAVKDDIDRFRDVITHLGKEEQKIKAAQQEGESELFVRVKKAKSSMREGEKLVEELEKSVGEVFLVTVDDSILMCVNGLEKFATVGRTDKQAIASKQKQTVRKENVGRTDKLVLSVEQKPNIRMNDDKNRCNITDCCLLDNGNMLLTDENNKCVKLFDKSYRAVDRCALQSYPQAVCSIGTGEVAIALYGSENVQIASVDRKIRLTRSFKVGEKSCTGASYCNNKLYITCRYNYKVKVYDTRGSLLQTLSDGNLGNDAWHNVATRDGGCIVTGGSQGIVAFDNSGKVTWTSQHADLEYAKGICEVGNWILVCCWENGHVFQVKREDQSCSILLHNSDELRNPRSLTYDQANEKLIVTKQYCGHMIVYNINRNESLTCGVPTVTQADDHEKSVSTETAERLHPCKVKKTNTPISGQRQIDSFCKGGRSSQTPSKSATSGWVERSRPTRAKKLHDASKKTRWSSGSDRDHGSD